MKNFIKNFVISILVISLFGLLLSHADQTRQYAFLGLNIWYEHMLPALLPFMILSGLMIDLRLEKLLVKPFSYILRPLFRISDAGIYTLIMGFLCGFPMGAKIVSYEFQKNNLTKKEAEYLLSFCNNFGPAYYLSFICGNVYPKALRLKGICILYAIPLLYGLLLRYTLYGKERFISPSDHADAAKPVHSPKMIIMGIHTNIIRSLSQIGILGGYMIFCNMLMAAVSVFLSGYPATLIHCLSEISGGIVSIKALDLNPALAFRLSHIALAFNGISCHLQTFYMIGDCPFSKKKYMLHKIILCSITCITFLCI